MYVALRSRVALGIILIVVLNQVVIVFSGYVNGNVLGLPILLG